MSDTSQGPGWWQASDGKWYPPESRSTAAPPPAAESKKKGGCLKLVLIAFGVLVLLAVLAVAVGGGGGDDDAGSTAGEGAEQAPSEAEGTTECTRTYADKQEKDRCREPGQDVELSGYTVSVSELVRHEQEFVGEQLCANVAIANRDDESQPYSSFDFRLQSPGGTIDDATIPFREPDLGSGDLAPGGSKQGWVCFDDTGASGEHIVIWKPDAFNADRGLWFFTV